MNTIVSIRKVANGGLQAEMQGTVEKAGAINVLAKLNAGDSRFKSGSDRRAWFPVTIQSLGESLGFTIEELEKIDALAQNERYLCKKENPSIDGHLLVIQVNETIVPDIYQRQHVMESAKQLEITDKLAANIRLNTKYDLKPFVGSVGYFLDTDGNHIFSRTAVTIKEQLNHTFVEGEFVPENMLAEFGATLAEPTKVEVAKEALQEA